ncbi:MAG: fluoride efflux transporter FluC [Sandaracinaceae bacterium]
MWEALLTALPVAFGGALGAVGRHGVMVAVQRVPGSEGWWAVLLANVLGCALIGALIGWLAAFPAAIAPPFALAERPLLRGMLVTGLCGALTTFSAFSLDNGILALEGRYRAVALNVGLSLGVGLGATYLALTLGSAP